MFNEKEQIDKIVGKAYWRKYQQQNETYKIEGDKIMLKLQRSTISGKKHSYQKNSWFGWKWEKNVESEI